MAPVRSLSTRLVATMLVAAAIMSAAIVALVVERVDRGLPPPTAPVMRLTDEKLAGRLDADARRARARLDQLADDVDRRFAAVVQSADATQAIGSQNVVAIAQALAPALALADIDGAVVLDTRARVVGASALAVDLLHANAALGGTWLAAAAVELASAKRPPSAAHGAGAHGPGRGDRRGARHGRRRRARRDHAPSGVRRVRRRRRPGAGLPAPAGRRAGP